MDRLVLRDLAVFEVVARHNSFTDAAAELGISQSALSYTVSKLEQRVGVALLARTTRSVAPTDVGRRLLQTLIPALHGIQGELDTLQELRETVSGAVRLTMVPVAYDTLIRPMLPSFFASHPDISVEVSTDEGLNDIVAEGFDGGIRFGTLVEKDMVATRLTKSSPVAIVGTPSYFATNLAMPMTPDDLRDHRCISYRFISSKRLYRWQLQKDGKAVDFLPSGPLVLNDGKAIRMAALDGLGLAYLFKSQISNDVAAGNLIEVLSDWLPDMPGFSLYYPDRRRVSPAFRALIDHLRLMHKGL